MTWLLRIPALLEALLAAKPFRLLVRLTLLALSLFWTSHGVFLLWGWGASSFSIGILAAAWLIYLDTKWNR